MKPFIYLLLILCLSSCQLLEVNKEPIPRGYQFGLSTATNSQLQNVPMAAPKYVGGSSGFPRNVILNVPPVIDQGSKQSCVSVVTGYYLSSYYKYLREFNNASQIVEWYQKQEKILSPEFIYNQLRRNYCDRGTSFIENLDLLKSDGVCSMAMMPYNGDACGNKPSRSAFNDAQNNKIMTFQKVNKSNLNDIKYFLVNRMPVLIGIQADEGLMELQKPYLVTGPSGQVLGNHAVTIVGYSDDKQAFLAANSWGEQWGERGRFWIAYSHLSNMVVNDEVYVVQHNFNFIKSNVDLNVLDLTIRWETLVARNILFPVNQKVTFNLNLLNKGIEAVGLNNVELAFVFSNDDVLDNFDMKPLTVTTINSTSALSPNRYITLNNVTARTREGLYIEEYPYLIVIVDPNDKVKEIDETNNKYVVKVL